MNSQDPQQRSLADALIISTPWTTFGCAIGEDSTAVGSALTGLLRTSEAGQVAPIRNAIENYVVPQSSLYEVAEPAMRVLAAVFADDTPRWVRVAALDLMYWILRGSAGTEGSEAGRVSLHERCAGRARESLWLLVRQVVDEPIFYEAVIDVVSLVDTDGAAISLLTSIGPGSPSPGTS